MVTQEPVPEPRGLDDAPLDATYEVPDDETLHGEEAPTSLAAVELRRGMSLGRYVVVDRIGAGGMGVVYAAYDPELDRRVAIKVLRARARRNATGPSRLMREAQALARVDHPNVVAIHDVGTHEGRVFVAMDYLEGPHLREWAEAPGRSWQEVLAIYLQAGEGLAAAHAAGIVHRDFKPENVIVADGRPRVLDFGLARASGHTGDHPTVDEALLRDSGRHRRAPSGSHPMASDSGSLSSAITRAGAVLGTPAFMSPEQHLGQAVGPASDQFSFAVALHEALYGESPFGGDTVASRAFAVTQGRLEPPPKKAKAPLWIRKKLLASLAVDPEQRLADMPALLASLRQDPARTRWRWGLGLGGVAVLALLAWSSARPAEVAICPDSERALASAWSETQRKAIDASFVRSELPYAQTVGTETLAGLDAYAETWRTMHTEACEATRVRREQSVERMDRRMACLDSARHRLGATAERLAQGDALALEHGPDLLAGLPDLERCADPESLMRAYPAPPPEMAARLQSLDAQLAEVLAQRAAGDLESAAMGMHDLTEAAAEVDHPPFRASLALARAELDEMLGEAPASERAIHEAMLMAERARDDRRLAEIRILAGLVIGDRLARTDEGYRWLELAKVSLERAGGDPGLEARRLNNLALVHSAAGRYDEELAAKKAALAMLESMPEADPLQIAAVHNNLAASLSQQGQHDEARTHAQRAIDMWSEKLGPKHPKVAIGYASLGLAHDYAGEYQQALPLHQKAVALLEESLGPQSPRVAEVLNNMAITTINLGDVKRGEELFTRVVEIKRSSLGEEHMEVATALGNRGSARRMLEDHEGALADQEHARQILERVLSPDHPRMATTLSGLANTYEEFGRIEEAIALRERVLGIEVSTYGPHSPEIAVDLGNLSWSLVDANNHPRARQLAAQGMDIVAKHQLKPDVGAFLRLVQARALLTERGHQKEARALVEQAIELLGDLPATAERDMIKKLDAEQGWAYAKAG